MAESKRRQRPKGAEIRDLKKPKAMQKKPSGKGYAASGALGATAAATAADMVGATDPYLSRNEFKEGFYEQNAGQITPQGLYGTASGKTMFESPIVDPDTSMMQNMAEGGSVRGQKAIQVKKKVFKGIF
jgi:hypothetical protein